MPADRKETTRDEIVRRLMEAQAELQTGLGMFRLDADERFQDVDSEVIEGYLARSLAMQQRLLALLGNPMYNGPTEDVVSRA